MKRLLNKQPCIRAFSWLILVSLVMTSLGGVAAPVARAQGKEPPTPTKEIPIIGEYDSSRYPSQILPENWEDKKNFLILGSSDGMSVQDEGVQVTLGEPGFSLRYVETFGVTEEAYPSSTSYLHRPDGLYLDNNDNLYVTEDRGCRVLKYDASGTNTLSVGEAGLCYRADQVFNTPRDVAVGSSGNIRIVSHNRVAFYDSNGNYQQDLPVDDPWQSGDDNTHFNVAIGIDFDSTGRMFVSDLNNHRVQVYTFLDGDPVYSTTIGETGVPGSDNNHFDGPSRIAVDSNDQLYVVDVGNNRVQRCTDNGGWSCTTFDSGLNSPRGIALDRSDNVYIVDSGNYRVRKCTPAGVCSDLITDVPGFNIDVAVDSFGDIYTSDWTYNVVREYNSNGVYQDVFIGEVDTPYQADTSRINTPSGVAVASDGSIYVTEEWGYRLLKLNGSGNQQWAVGQAGVYGNDNAHFGDYWAGPRADLAVDSTGRIYVTDTGNHRVQIFNADGSYYNTFGSYGTGISQFADPSGVAIHPTSGDIYVADEGNHRVLVYDSSWTYKATIGETSVSGSDGVHFNHPAGVTVDATGNVFVSDRDNDRVQKCTLSGSSGTCITFAGMTGESGQDFDHFDNPAGLAVDDVGRVYVVDRWNNRVQVFDSSGAYLTSISGSWGWGSDTGQLRSPADVAVDDQGNVYVTDNTNHRVQKYAPGVPDWEQTNINGFGDRLNQDITSLAV